MEAELGRGPVEGAMELESIKQEIREATLDPTLEPDPFTPLDELLDRAEEQSVLPLVLSVTEGSILEEGVHPAHYYLFAAAHFRLDRPDAAYRAVIPLAGRLETERRWKALGLLAARAMENDPRVEAGLFLAKALENAGLDWIDPAFLRKAYDNFPNESRLAFLMGELRAQEAKATPGGETSDEGKRLLMEARFFWAESLDGFILHKRGDQIDEVILKLVDGAHPDTMRRVLAAMKKLAASGQWGRFQVALESLLPAFQRAGLVREVWNLLLEHVGEAPASVGIRKQLAELARNAFPNSQGVDDLLQRTGILDPSIPVNSAMRALEPMLAFLPGSYVLHASWGVGRVLSNDTENLIIDFADASAHRMSVGLARRALEVVPAGDLRVMVRENPEELKTMVKENPTEVAYLGLRQLGGQGKTADLKRVLTTSGVMPPTRWTTWWKDAKSAMEADPRFDLSQAFRQVYKIRTGADMAGGIDYPVVEPRRGIRPNLNLIRRFLDQHPRETQAAAQRYARILERWAGEERTNPEDRMAIHLQLYRWRKEASEAFTKALEEMIPQGVEASSFPDVGDQRLLTEVGLSHKDTWRDTVCFALSSRHPEVRELAMEKLRSDAEAGRSLLRDLIQNPADRPLAALAVIHRSVRATPADKDVLPDVWESAMGAAHLVESTSRDQIRKLALGLLVSEGALAAKLAQTEPSDTLKEQWGFLLRKWRSSERYLQPVLRILKQAGLQQVVDDFRAEQIEKTNRALGAQDETDYSGTMMTRQTFERLRKELETMNYELKTTVAQAIAKARAHGDLRENAEFEAAKQKQADYMERIGSLTLRLGQARMIDDLKIPENEVGPGTLVVLEQIGTGEHHSHWLLGEGDDVYGQDVLSYASPLGRELLGKKVSERITLLRSDGAVEFVIKSVQRKLPNEAESATRA